MGLFDFLKMGGKKQDDAVMPTDNTSATPVSTDVPAPNTNSGEAAAMPAAPADPAASMTMPEATTSGDVQSAAAPAMPAEPSVPADPAMPAADGSLPASDGSSSDGQPPVTPAV